jgi:soluble lytic murein transglycosylase-like protein
LNKLSTTILLALVISCSKDNGPIDYKRPVVQRQTSSIQPYNRLLSQATAYSTCNDPKLGLSIIQIESAYNNVRSTEGSLGLMQVQVPTARWMKCSGDLMDPVSNVECGCKFLNHLLSKYKLNDAIASYNAGSPRLCRTGHLRPSGKACSIGKYINDDYVTKVLSVYRRTL